MEAQEWCRKYQRSGNVKDLTQAWDLYYLVFRRISKQLPQVRLKLFSQEGNHCFIQIHVAIDKHIHRTVPQSSTMHVFVISVDLFGASVCFTQAIDVS